MKSISLKEKWYALQIRQWEREYIYIPNREWEYSRKIKDQRRREEIMTSLYLNSKNKGYLKRIYMREGKKEKKSMRWQM